MKQACRIGSDRSRHYWRAAEKHLFFKQTLEIKSPPHKGTKCGGLICYIYFVIFKGGIFQLPSIARPASAPAAPPMMVSTVLSQRPATSLPCKPLAMATILVTLVPW